MKTRYIIYSRFNSDIGLSKQFHVSDSLSEKWIAYRLLIFNLYTRRSLEAQTNQDFLSVLNVHPDSMSIVEAELKKYPPLPPHIVFTSDKNQTIETYIRDADQLYLCNLDSDDMYHPSFVQFLHEHPTQKDKPLLLLKNGYILNTNTHVVNHYYSPSPPFFAEIFDVKDYLSYARFYPPLAHGYMERFNHETITQRLFMIILHDRNTWPNYRREVPKVFETNQILPDWQEVLKDYHLI
ncbi:MAG: hypothetical protein K0S30_1690 [Clostridia bacterium]|jgi:hypothetical protein|nr:hypothetical protein [Clostridia bacterium]